MADLPVIEIHTEKFSVVAGVPGKRRFDAVSATGNAAAAAGKVKGNELQRRKVTRVAEEAQETAATPRSMVRVSKGAADAVAARSDDRNITRKSPIRNEFLVPSWGMRDPEIGIIDGAICNGLTGPNMLAKLSALANCDRTVRQALSTSDSTAVRHAAHIAAAEAKFRNDAATGDRPQARRPLRHNAEAGGWEELGGVGGTAIASLAAAAPLLRALSEYARTNRDEPLRRAVTVTLLGEASWFEASGRQRALADIAEDMGGWDTLAGVAAHFFTLSKRMAGTCVKWSNPADPIQRYLGARQDLRAFDHDSHSPSYKPFSDAAQIAATRRVLVLVQAMQRTIPEVRA
jgi:hypothetical protein